jgi:hypothetical protein
MKKPGSPGFFIAPALRVDCLQGAATLVPPHAALVRVAVSPAAPTLRQRGDKAAVWLL